MTGLLAIFDHLCTVKGCFHGIYRRPGRPPLDPRRPCSVHRQAHALVGRVLEEHGEEIAENMANDEALWEGLDKIRSGSHRKCSREGCVELVEVKTGRRGKPRSLCDIHRAPPVRTCRECGDDLPPPRGKGRPSVRCEGCRG